VKNVAVGFGVNPPILLYHRVCRDDEWLPSEFVVTRSVFREQMRTLARTGHYTPRLSEVLARGGRAPRTTKEPVVITFDDGYADTLENALPVLEEVGFTAAVFPVLDLRRRFNGWDADPALAAPLLTPAGMRSLEAAGVELGSHTVTHPHLTHLGDAELGEELERSREILGSIVARPLPVLAYPFGDVDERVKAAVRRSGYVAALAVNTGPLGVHADRFEIRRVCVGNSASEAYLTLKVSGAEKLYRWLRWKAKASFYAQGRSRPGPPAPHAA
jgi:peptidoglycan/xylan/chitin deacetylase (PgdA/CDA1 family)